MHWISSEILCTAATVAAPMQKLWHLYDDLDRPAHANDFCSWSPKNYFDTGMPPGNMNNGPGDLVRTAREVFIVCTGQKGEDASAEMNNVTGGP